MGQKNFIFITLVIAAILIGAGVYFFYQRNPESTNQQPASTASTVPTTTSTPPSPSHISTEYKNDEFGFEFALPSSWTGYTIVTTEWEGYVPSGSQGDVTSETGALISIRHPRWTNQNPRQDIPIMVFTVPQWDSLQQGAFHLGAAPINPSELGRNSRSVFALPARYNFAFLTGHEEVDQILQSEPLQAFD